MAAKKQDGGDLKQTTHGSKATAPAAPAAGKQPVHKISKQPDIVKADQQIDFKAQLTDKELRFIAAYLSGNMSKENAMIEAGYGDYSQNHRYFLAKRIIEKYESGAGDHRKIFRAVGAGEVAVARGLIDLARNAKSEMVRLNAWAMIAKCLGLQKDVVDLAGGISIVVNTGPQQPTGQPGGGGSRPTITNQSAPKAPRTSLTILK